MLVAAQASGLAARGHEVTVATALEADTEGRALVPENLAVKRFNVQGDGRLRGGYSGDIEAYVQFVASHPCDMIICHCWQIWSTDLAIRAFPDTTACKIIVSQGFDANWPKKGDCGLMRRIVRWILWLPYVSRLPRMLKAFDHLVFLSSRADRVSFYDHLVAKRMNMSNVSLIPNGCFIDSFDKDKKAFRSSHGLSERFLLLCVANYGLRKNQELALNAFLRARRKDAALVFIGSSHNDYAKHVERCYEDSPLREECGTVLFLNKQARETICRAYDSADLFLLTSEWEAQPLVLLDAMAAGVPFISTSSGCVADLPGGVIADTERTLSAQINVLLDDEGKRIRLGEQGHRACVTVYDWNIVLDKYEALLGLLA